MKPPQPARLAALLLTAAATAWSASPASAAQAAAPPAAAPAVQHVDCSSTAAGTPDGSAAHPWTTLDQANAIVLTPGQQLLLARGSRCTGTLAPQGAGAPGAPVTVGAYGSGAKPVVDGNGNTDTVRLLNTQWIELRDLDITNPEKPGTKKRGVLVRLTDYGTGTHYRLSGLDIHDIRGDDTKDADGSAGILFSVTGSAKPTRFHDVAVEDNRLRTIDREGISIASSWNQRPAISGYDPDGPAWTPSTGVAVRGNRLDDIGGDGIVITSSDGALVEHNTVRGFQLRSAGYNAGIWPWDADHTTLQYNDVSGGGNTRDGMAYDVDEGTYGTVFQYNYSHDNAGGFFLVCTADGDLGDAVIRYNVSRNDHYRGIENCKGSYGRVQFYNNTVYIGDGVGQTVVNENTDAAHPIEFRNNVIAKTGSGTASFNLRSGKVTLAANTLSGVTGAPADPGGSTADPRFTHPSNANPSGLRLAAGSPALGTGVPIPDDGGRDFFANRIPSPPNQGAYAGPGLGSR